MIGRRSAIRLAMLVGCVLFLLALTLELLRRSKPEFFGEDIEMLYPEVMTGVLVTGFEESSFFPGAASIPDRNDPRRYRLSLVIDHRRVAKAAGNQILGPAYHAVAITFLGRRTKYPVGIDCYGGREYYFLADWIFSARDLGAMDSPDRPPLPSERPAYEPFKRSGEGGVIARMEEESLDRCGGSSHGAKRVR